MTKYSLESEYRIYNDERGSYLRVGLDTDGLDLPTISFHGEGAKELIEISMSKEELPLLIKALQKLEQDLKCPLVLLELTTA